MDSGVKGMDKRNVIVSRDALLNHKGLRVPLVKLTMFTIACAIFLALIPFHASAAVTVSSFTAKWQGTQVLLEWKTATEVNSAGFNVLRSASASGTFAKINGNNMIPSLSFGSIAGASYSFIDTSVTPGRTYYYKLEAIDNRDGRSLFGPATASSGSTPTPTATATATKTRTPTATATHVPGAPTATSLPQFTPTRTATYPPGVTPPSATPTLVRVAAAQPSATAMRPGASPVAPAPTQIALAPQESTPEDVGQNEENTESAADSQDEGDTRAQRLIRSGVILLSGLLGVGAVACGSIAAFLFMRISRR